MKQFLQSTLQVLINRYISLDVEIDQKLKPLRGKILEVQIQKTPFHYGFLFTKNRIEVISADKITADATIRGELFIFLKLFKSFSVSDFSKLSITGDQMFSENAYHLLQDLDIDWEELLSHYTGDVIAHKMGQCVQGFKKWFQRGTRSFETSLTEYLQEELRYLPSAAEVNDFMDEVDQLKHDLDRLSLRISTYLQESHD